MNHQLELFRVSAETTRVPRSARSKIKSASPPAETPLQPNIAAQRVEIPHAHRAPCGDLFREMFEVQRSITLADRPDQRTLEDDRADLYWRMYWHPIFGGRRKLKGPIDQLQRKVGRNRCAEFDGWLRRIGAQGSTTSVRYRRLLVTVERELRNVDTRFQYLRRADSSSDINPARRAFARLEKAQSDVVELRELFSDVAVLYRQLREARLESAHRILAWSERRTSAE